MFVIFEIQKKISETLDNYNSLSDTLNTLYGRFLVEDFVNEKIDYKKTRENVKNFFSKENTKVSGEIKKQTLNLRFNLRSHLNKIETILYYFDSECDSIDSCINVYLYENQYRIEKILMILTCLESQNFFLLAGTNPKKEDIPINILLVYEKIITFRMCIMKKMVLELSNYYKNEKCINLLNAYTL